MSAKIYDGLISTEPDLFKLGDQIRHVLEPLFIVEFGSIYQEIQDIPEGGKWSDSSLFFRENELIPDERTVELIYDKVEQLNDSPMRTLSDADICYSVCVLKNMGGGNPLVMVFGENSREYTNALLESGVVKEYGYWDNSDPDEDLSEDEWDKRKIAWGELLGNNAPSEVSLEISYPTIRQCTNFVS